MTSLSSPLTENAARLHIAEQVFADLNFSAPPQGSHIWLHLPQPW
mgnify:CR=1 FL=1